MPIRGKNLISNIPYTIERYEVLSVGTEVTIKDKKWYDSLEYYRYGDGIETGKYLKYNNVLLFTSNMANLLGKRAQILSVTMRNDGLGGVSPHYKLRILGEDKNKYTHFTFTNEMLER
jgi:hypothetical protein